MSETQLQRQRLGRNEARDVILSAAARVFNLRGRAATVEEIAHEAGYSTSALYKHFSNKNDIFRTLWETVGEQMLELHFGEPPVELGFLERLKWMLYRMVQYAEEERELFLAGMANMPTGGSMLQLDPDVMESFVAMHNATVALMERGIAEGVLRPGSGTVYAMALGGHLRVLAAHWALLGPFPLKPRVDEVLEIFLMGAASEQGREALQAGS